MNNVQFEACKVCGKPKNKIQFENTLKGVVEKKVCINKCKDGSDGERGNKIRLQH
jgi:hypothetical protein